MSIDEIATLDLAQRIVLVEEIWDTIALEQENVQLSETEKVILDQRLNSLELHPDNLVSWDEIKRKLHA